MKIKKSKYVFYNSVKKIERYLYGILDDDNILRIVNESGQDPHLVYYKNDFNGIWGAIDELMHFQGEDVSLQEYNKLLIGWTEEYESKHPRYTDNKDTYYRVQNYTDNNMVIYTYDGTETPLFVMDMNKFNKKYTRI